jgi:glycosyltransferase involved in cell wall biosynthesis
MHHGKTESIKTIITNVFNILRSCKIMPEISIITPVFNGERYLQDSIGSIYKTIHKTQWELLLCNDGSTDNSHAQMCNRSFDKRVHIIYNSTENQGAAIARNRLIAEASSDVIMVLDCDNILEDGLVDRLYREIKEGAAVVAPEKLQYFTDMNNIDPTDAWDFSYLNGNCDKQDMLTSFKNPPSSGNCMYRKEVWKAVDGYHKEDIQETWGFGFRHIFAGYPIKILNGSKYYHRFCKDGYYMRLPKDEMEKAFLRLLWDVKDQLTDDSIEYLKKEKSGKAAILSGRLKLK